MRAVFEVLITSSVLIVGILALRRLTMGKISMRLRYGLWLLVALRLLMPVSLGTSPFSVMNLFSAVMQETSLQRDGSRASGTEVVQGRDGTEQEKYSTEQGNVGLSGVKSQNGETVILLQNPAQGTVGAGAGSLLDGDGTPDGAESGTVAQIGRVTVSQSVTWRFVVLAVWVCGFLAVSGYMLFLRLRFGRYLQKKRRKVSAAELPGAIREKLTGCGIKVYQVKGLPSPCLVGRHIYIGDQTPGGEQGLVHVLAHEYCHARHGDGFWAFLRCALAALYWFDPFVWAAAFAARQDSDLACDEAVVRLLGEEERFAYGRTLLSLLQENGSGTECPGMPLMFSGSERGVRERIVSLTGKIKAEGVVLAAVLSLVFLICGCAFTGAQTGEDAAQAALQDSQGENEGAQTDGRQMVNEENNEEFARIQKEYEDTVKNVELTEEQIKELEESALREADRAAFEEILNYHGAMEGRDDSELSLDRQVDVQHFIEYMNGRQETAPETGWYLLCRAEEEPISVYGLFTEEFGCRGMKLLIGEDVNTFDRVWHPSLLNGISNNIRVMEYAEDGMPRRFVWKYMEEESSVIEKWRLAGGYRYDTGTVDAVFLSEQEYLSWADWHLTYLTYDIDPQRQQVRVYYDGSEDVLAGVLDISNYEKFSVEEVRIQPESVSFEVDSDLFEEGGMIIHLLPGLQFEGVDGLWSNGLHPIAVEVLWKEDGTGFRFGRPMVDERYVLQNPAEERAMEALLEEQAEAEQAEEGGEGRLSEPLVNAADNHHDLEIAFRNPCPDYERISDAYGERVHPATGESRAHNGVDLAAPEGVDVLAAAEGTVYETGFDAEYGNYVVLWHGQSGQMTYYTHCKEVVVSEGAKVEAGEKIATVGKTGRATGSFLHFAVSYDGEWQEPVWG